MKMTSFAEQKFRKIVPDGKENISGGGGSLTGSPKSTPCGSGVENSGSGVQHSVSWAPLTPEGSPAYLPLSQPPRDPAQAMAAEMVQLRMRLEEKRRAIEAQKRKVEAAFTRHRQKMGRSAFLDVVRRRGDETPSPTKEEAQEKVRVAHHLTCHRFISIE